MSESAKFHFDDETAAEIIKSAQNLTTAAPYDPYLSCDTEEEAEETVGEKSDKVEAKAAELTYEEKYEKARKIMLQNPNYRWVLYHILKKCNEGKPYSLNELEEYVMTEPGYARLKQPPYFPISWLEHAYALEERYYDAEGNSYTKKDLEDYTEDEFDDLVESYAYTTTDVGQGIIEEFSPTEAIKGLMAESELRQEIYADLLSFVVRPRKFADIDRRIRRSKTYEEVLKAESKEMMPIVFVDKLSVLGGIAYENGWQITPEGKELLDILTIEPVQEKENE